MAGKKRGPKELPTKLHVLKGNRSRKKKDDLDPTGEPQPDAPDSIEAPEYLDMTGKAEWNRVAPKLLQLGLLTDIDLPALGVYCEAYSRYMRSAKQLKTEALTTKYNSGAVVQNVLVGVMNTSIKVMKDFMTEFGMTPSARARMRISPQKKETIDPRAAAL